MTLPLCVVGDGHRTTRTENIIHELGIAAAGYLERTVESSTTLGISWGSTLNAMVAALHPRQLPKTKVVQIIGGLGQPEAEVHATDLCHRLARTLGSQLTLLPVPGIVATQQARNVLLSDPFIRQATEMFNSLEVAFVGIDAPNPNSVLLRDGSILSTEELDFLLKNGAVGDIALRFFNAQGEPVDSEINQRVIGLTFVTGSEAGRHVADRTTRDPRRLRVLTRSRDRRNAASAGLFPSVR